MTEHSAVGAGHRAWFKISCAYTVAFASLAMIEELKVQAASPSIMSVQPQ